MPEPTSHRLAFALALGGTYLTWGTVEWFVLYQNRPRLTWRYGDEAWFSDSSYTGGADKLGHFWANLAYSRLGADVLQAGGWKTLPASLLGAGMSFVFFFLVEVKDGLFHVFSTSDLAANGAGALLGVAMQNLPGLDAALDVRLQWFPSRQFRRSSSANFVEDYSGQSYLFAFKPRAVRAVRDGRWVVRWLEFVNPVVGFQTRGYKPAPSPSDPEIRRQEIFVGVTLDLQSMFDEMLAGAASRAGRWAHKITRNVTEYVNLPYTTLQTDVVSRSPDTP